MLEDERSELERRIAMVRRLASPLLDDLARERFEALLRDLEQRLAIGAELPPLPLPDDRT
jgi:hypothetical protein